MTFESKLGSPANPVQEQLDGHILISSTERDFNTTFAKDRGLLQFAAFFGPDSGLSCDRDPIDKDRTRLDMSPENRPGPRQIWGIKEKDTGKDIRQFFYEKDNSKLLMVRDWNDQILQRVGKKNGVGEYRWFSPDGKEISPVTYKDVQVEADGKLTYLNDQKQREEIPLPPYCVKYILGSGATQPERLAKLGRAADTNSA
jgi:hypothetical protein